MPTDGREKRDNWTLRVRWKVNHKDRFQNQLIGWSLPNYLVCGCLQFWVEKLRNQCSGSFATRGSTFKQQRRLIELRWKSETETENWFFIRSFLKTCFSLRRFHLMIFLSTWWNRDFSRFLPFSMLNSRLLHSISEVYRGFESREGHKSTQTLCVHRIH